MMLCVICESAATSLHFGAPSCKACAAFFRRTVALNITYECLTGQNTCEVSSERRMFCKKCRYDKCIRNNMKRIMVQSKRGRPDCKEEESAASPYGAPDACNSCASTSSPASEVCCRFREDEDSRKLIDHISRMDSNLNKSRRLAFTNARLLDIFAGSCKMPFEKEQLRELDFRSYNGYAKHEYLMMFSYANSLPDFPKLCDTDQNFLFRLTAGVDFVLSCAFYTMQIGIENNILVNHDGTYILMEPLPPIIEECDALTHFHKKDEFEKYKNLIQPRVKTWKEFIPKYEELNMTFEENAILKALASWQMAQYNFDDNGKEISKRQKSKLTKCLLRLCQDTHGDEEGSIRAGNIIMFVSLINDEVMELISTLLILSFFEIIEGDALISEILTTRSLFT